MVLPGVAVSSTMFGTTALLYMVMLIIWETNFFLATAFLIGFGFIDMVYVTGRTFRRLYICASEHIVPGLSL